MVQAHYKSFIRSDFKWRNSSIPVSPLGVVADYAGTGTSNIGFWTKDFNHSAAIESCWSTFSCLTPAAVKRLGLAVHFGIC